MSQRTELLNLERKKLSLLRSKVEVQERRVNALEQMEDDPWDALLERELAAMDTEPTQGTEIEVHDEPQSQLTVQTPAPIAPRIEPQPIVPGQPAVSWGHALRNPRRVPPLWVKLLRYIGREGKTYEQVVDFVSKSGLAISHGAARTQLMNYRKDYGFVENPSKGFYKATEKALNFIATQEGEDPAVGTGGVFNLQPTPLDRAAA